MDTDYVDFIKEINKQGGPFQFVRNAREFPTCSQFGRKATNRSPKDIIESVLNSDKVMEAVRQYAAQNNVSVAEGQKQCRNIMEQMAHDFTLSNVRIFGYIITKVITTVFDEILVNAKQLRALRETFKDTPVIFIPTHRTYIDFLLLSVLCFDQEMTLPAIAAAMDFMNSKMIGEILRQCGAFFIRRAVGDDILYWAIFTEYVQTHIVEGDRPVEFFIEGTRSRTNKSLPPKYGLLQILLEPYLRGNIYDMVVVPVAMNYDKILEEQLYAYELLGFPKPKESTSGLLKARSILDKSFGRVQVTFGKPISIREHLGVSIKRATFVCQPDSQWKMSEVEKRHIRAFGHHIIKNHYEMSSVSVWSIACSSIILLTSDAKDNTVKCGDFLKLTHNLIDLLRSLEIQVHIRKTVAQDLERAFKLHSDFITIEGDAKDPNSIIRLTELKVDGKKTKISKDILSQAVSLIILTNHANSSMHVLSTPSIFSLALLSSSSIDKLKECYKWLRTVLYSEFVHDPLDVDNEFDRIVQSFTLAGLIESKEESVIVKDINYIEILSRLTKPYLLILSVMIDVLMDVSPLHITMSEATSLAQNRLIQLHDRDSSVLLSSLSADILKNAFTTLDQRGGLQKLARNYSIHPEQLNNFKKQLTTYVELPGRSSKI
ncbi:acl-7 [Pristionchus pacificus]|uniref:Acl-7 n=1 Tax=Pristionchus pacificus TaxID=54126 RepID=A0A2A6D3A5_PRIPA|nr:acl-7 [Pristionchus pacificus]|eukprot:PDM84840.1 acl-7 [Pristionchus pacificus]